MKSNNERYRYSRTGTRIIKLTRRCTYSSQTRYLPGMEIHTKDDAENVVTSLINGVRIQPNGKVRYPAGDRTGSITLELDASARLLSREHFYPYGGTALWATSTQTEAWDKPNRHSGKERDVTGLYYYGFRYYAVWMMRWLNTDPAGTVDGLNLFRMTGNNPITLRDDDGRMAYPKNADFVKSTMGDYQHLQQQLEEEKFYRIDGMSLYLEKDLDALLREGYFERNFDFFTRGKIVNSSGVNDEINSKSWFSNKFKQHKWTSINISRDPTKNDYFTADAILRQYASVSDDKSPFRDLPSIVKHRGIDNDKTNDVIRNLREGDDLNHIFLTKTPNGKCIQRVLDRIGFKATDTISVNYGYYTDIYVLIEPDTKIHRHFTIHSARKPATPLASSSSR